MNLVEFKNTIERLDQMIRLKMTGTVACLAKKLEKSERQIYRLIRDLKNLGMPIKYCRVRKTYYYEQPVELILFRIKKN